MALSGAQFDVRPKGARDGVTLIGRGAEFRDFPVSGRPALRLDVPMRTLGRWLSPLPGDPDPRGHWVIERVHAEEA